ncbi:MAG TPA: hypothetical protein PLI22_07590 [Caldisericia bacterium]|nr:hypothetical protein [Caldisericia bacterium]
MKKVKKDLTEEKNESLSLFDHLNNLTENKTEYDPMNDVQTKSYEPYMINRYISMCDFYLPLVNEINKYDIPKNVHYRYFLSSLPKRKQFFKYISKGKDVNKDDKEKIAKYFECGNREAEMYLEILSEDQVKTIVQKFDYGKTK